MSNVGHVELDLHSRVMMRKPRALGGILANAFSAKTAAAVLKCLQTNKLNLGQHDMQALHIVV